jgi:general stress protein 26
MESDSFADIADSFIESVHSAVWCNAATVDRQGRPRSRVLHPIWEVADGRPVGWIATGRKTLKTKHLAQRPYMSLAYIVDPLKPIYVECRTEWVDDTTAKQRLWNWFRSVSPPLGYDPSPFFGSADNPGFGTLKLVPWRVELGSLTSQSRVWQASDD